MMHNRGNPEETSFNSFSMLLVPTTTPQFIPRGVAAQKQGSKNLKLR